MFNFNSEPLADSKYYLYNLNPHNARTIISQEVDLGLAPWKSGGTEVYITRQLAGPDEIWIDVKLLPNRPFIYKIDPFDARQLLDQFVLKIAEAAFKFYRYRPITPVDDHIILGED